MKKLFKKTLVSALIITMLSTITWTAILMENIKINNDVFLINDNLNKTLPTTSEKTLTRKIADDLGWSTKEHITLNDWKTQAPNVTGTPGYSSDPKSVSPWKNNNVIKTIQIPKTFIRFGDDVFKLAENLESITFEPGSKLKRIDSYFIEATKIRTIIIPDSVDTVKQNTFTDASSLQNITMPIHLKDGAVFQNMDLQINNEIQLTE